ncbi:MAG: hypothetical protein QM626_08530 [Microbacterium sp.]|uniref:hypothetical protein n=1 Tax=Microbacterium sp. TaxID=51671 RepID=UPI0039E68206
MRWMTDAAALAALAPAETAVGDVVAHLDLARVAATELDEQTAWVSPAATAFRLALAEWHARLDLCRAQAALLRAEVAAARSAATGPAG